MGNKEVFFDDLKIMHESSNAAFRVTQINDYYPFGMPTANSWRAPGYIDPGLLYQSAFSVLDSLTGFYDFLSRNYDPALGRFPQVDPAGQFASPYAGMGNVPHMGVDPNGEWLLPALTAVASVVVPTLIQGLVETGNNGGNYWNNVANIGFQGGTSFSGNGWQFNNNAGGSTPLSGPNGGSPVFGGFSPIGYPDASYMGYTNFGSWTDHDSWVTQQYNFQYGQIEPVVNSYPSQYTSNFVQASGGSTGSAGSEALGWIGVIAGAVEEGASNATPLIQRNLPAISDAGNVVGNWKITSKTGTQVLNYTKSGAKFVGNGAAGLAVVVDGVDLANGDLSVQRFSYRTFFNGAAVGVGTFVSGGLGALVGGIGIFGERAYDTWTNDVLPAMRSAMPTGNWSGFTGFR